METNIIPIHQIVAIDEKGGIGLGGTLPWSLRKDWEHFLRMTTKVKVCAFEYNFLEDSVRSKKILILKNPRTIK